MKKSLKEQFDNLEKVFGQASESSNEAVKAIVDSCTKELSQAIEANRDFLDTIKSGLYTKGLDPGMISSIKKSFSNGIELSEQTIDEVIEAHSKRCQSSIEFNEKLLELLKTAQFSSEEEVEKIVHFLKKNFETGFNKSLEELKTFLDYYNRHVNVALNFNRKFGSTIKNQIDEITKLQDSNVTTFTNWATEWWKQTQVEKEVMV